MAKRYYRIGHFDHCLLIGGFTFQLAGNMLQLPAVGEAVGWA